MRLLICLLALFGLACTVSAWSKEDHEVFDLVSALEQAEGKGMDFYKHLGVEASATLAQLNKAYRKKSLELHPDKNPGVKDIQARFARLGVITQILRSPESRERYNFFYKNGVPKWRGTGYYYSRYRPTLLHTLTFLVFLTSLFHYLIMKMNYAKDKKRVDYFEQAARTSAGLPPRKEEGTAVANGNGSGNGAARRRKVKVPMVAGSEFSGQLELIVDGEDVFVPHGDGTMEPISDLATKPSYLNTWPYALSLKLARQLVTYLPPSTQSNLPPFLLPSAEPDSHLTVEDIVPPLSATQRKKAKKSRDNTPKDSPAATEGESEDGEAAGENGEVTAVKKKSKPGLGKAGGARRRKMGMK